MLKGTAIAEQTDLQDPDRFAQLRGRAPNRMIGGGCRQAPLGGRCDHGAAKPQQRQAAQPKQCDCEVASLKQPASGAVSVERRLLLNKALRDLLGMRYCHERELAALLESAGLLTRERCNKRQRPLGQGQPNPPAQERLLLCDELAKITCAECCKEDQLADLLGRVHGVVRRVRTILLEVRPLGGDSYEIEIDALKPTVGEAKEQISRVGGTEPDRQLLCRVQVSDDGSNVREHDQEPEELRDDGRELGVGDVLALSHVPSVYRWDEGRSGSELSVGFVRERGAGVQHLLCKHTEEMCACAFARATGQSACSEGSLSPNSGVWEFAFKFRFSHREERHYTMFGLADAEELEGNQADLEGPADGEGSESSLASAPYFDGYGDCTQGNDWPFDRSEKVGFSVNTGSGVMTFYKGHKLVVRADAAGKPVPPLVCTALRSGRPVRVVANAHFPGGGVAMYRGRFPAEEQ
eukprot:g1510.t1